MPNDPINPDVAKKLLEAMTALLNVTTLLGEGLGVVDGHIKKATDEVDDLGRSFKNVISLADSAKEQMKDMLGFLRKTVDANRMGIRTLADAKKHYEDIAAFARKALTTAKENSTEALVFRRTLEECEHTLEGISKIASQVGKGLSTSLKECSSEFDPLEKGMKRTLALIEQISDSVKGIKFDKFTRGFQSINNMFGRSGGRVEKYTRMARNADDIKETATARGKTKSAEFELKKARFDKILNHHSVRKKLEEESPEIFKNGEILQPDKIFENDRVRKAAMKILNPKAGFFDRRATEGLLRKGGMSALDPGGRLALGGGSATEAMFGEGEAALAGGLSTLMGRAALPLAIGGAAFSGVKKVVDASAQQSKGIEKDLGKGGIFTGSDSGGDSMQNVKNNLRAWGFNGGRVTTERQQAVAAAMVNNGMAVTNLGHAGNTMADGHAGAISDIGDIAMNHAREFGLTDTEGTEAIIKLLHGYQMTMQGTQRFFQQMGKSIASSGISTMKYLQIIDDVTSQFDRMGKSIGNTTSILRVLGQSGTSTFDDLKDELSALIGTEKSHEQKAFLTQSMTPWEREGLGKELDATADNAAENFREALKNAAGSILKDKEGDSDEKKADNLAKRNALENAPLSTAEEINKAMIMYSNAGGNKEGDANTNQLSSLQKIAIASRVNANGIKGDAVNASFLNDFMPTTNESKMAMQLQAYRVSAKAAGLNLGDVANNENLLTHGHAAAVMSSTASALGVTDAEKKNILPMMQGIQKIANSTFDEVSQHGEEATGKDKEEFERLAEAMLKNAEGGPIAKDKDKTAIQTLKNNPGYWMAVKQGYNRYIANTPAELQKVVGENSVVSRSQKAHNEETAGEQYAKVVGIANSVESSEDLLKGIKEALTGSISNVLTDTYEVLRKQFGDAEPELDKRLKNQDYRKDEDFLSAMAGSKLKDIMVEMSPAIEGHAGDEGGNGAIEKRAAVNESVGDIVKELMNLKEKYKSGHASDAETARLKELTSPEFINRIVGSFKGLGKAGDEIAEALRKQFVDAGGVIKKDALPDVQDPVANESQGTKAVNAAALAIKRRKLLGEVAAVGDTITNNTTTYQGPQPLRASHPQTLKDPSETVVQWWPN